MFRSSTASARSARGRYPTTSTAGGIRSEAKKTPTPKSARSTTERSEQRETRSDSSVTPSPLATAQLRLWLSILFSVACREQWLENSNEFDFLLPCRIRWQVLRRFIAYSKVLGLDSPDADLPAHSKVCREYVYRGSRSPVFAIECVPDMCAIREG